MQSPENGVPRLPSGDVAKMYSLPSDLLVLPALLMREELPLYIGETQVA